MAYVKNYNPGKITMDLPTANYIYELPLLSVGDIHGALNLSLVFNYGMKEESTPFNIAAGYKLNLQKRLILENGMPIEVQDESGKRVSLIGDSFPYTFADKSQRILRQTGIADTPYVIENSDFSTDKYNPDGMIAAVIDKYSATVLEYEYDSNGRLETIVYRGSKTVNFSYTGNQLSKITYANAACSTSFVYVPYGPRVFHYSGVTYNIMQPNASVFTAEATAIEGETTITHTTSLSNSAANTMEIIDRVDGEIVNTTTYVFPESITDYTQNFSQVEITNNEGVKTRVQYQMGKPLYSYELVDGDVPFFGTSHTGVVRMYNTVDSLSATHDAKLVTVDTGLKMYRESESSNRWKYDVTDYAAGDANRYFLLTGWIKRNTESSVLNDAVVNVSCDPNSQGIQFSPRVVMDDKWKFFAYKVHMGDMSSSFLYVCPDGGNVELNDLRLFFPTPTPSADKRARMILSEDILITSQNKIIPIHNTIFTCGSTAIPCSETVDLEHDGVNNYVNFHELLRYMCNQQKNANTTEFYYNNNNARVVASAPSITVTNGSITDDLSNCCLGKRSYTTNGAVITKVYQESAAVLACETLDKDNVVLSRQLLNSNMDVISATADGVTTTYTRNTRGLVASESVAGLYTRSTEYGNNTVKITDEFGEETTYTMDSVWGTVKSVTLPDGTVVTDEYDDDMCTMTKRIFGNAAGRSNSLTYSAGNLSRLQTGDLYYSFGYSKGDLTGIQKNGTQIETHVHTDTAVRSYYPHGGAPLHSTVTNFDKYGRLTSVYGVLTNVYDSAPTFDSSTGALIATADNGSALLAMTTDELRGETARYKYNQKGLLEEKTVTDAADFADKISEEVFVYDTANRLSDHTVAYTGAGFGVISGTITYKKDATDPTVDNTVSSYTHKVGDKQKAYTENTTDDYHRLTKKNITVDTTKFTKRYYYKVGRVTRLMDAMGTTMVGDYSYTYDEMGRIRSVDYTCASSADDYKRYTYDQYGQLIREDNLGLAKTYVYEYNDIGNITSVKVYNYSLDTTPSGTPVTTTFGYTNDQLTSFGGEAIAYDSVGCPTTYEGMTASWTRGKLSRLFSGSAAAGSSSYVYNYNAFGQRVSKTYSYTQGTSGLNPMQTGQVINCGRNYYYDHAGRLIAETIGKTLYDAGSTSEQIVYLYDEGSIVGMEYTTGGVSTLYYFQRNLQGDVTAIFDTSGNMVVKYLYDAWGNCTISSETTNYAVANANPIRYRGYYYDDDTGLYYCNARYYSPKWRRFISPDDTSYLNPESVNGLNLYCYCNNDPVNYTDPSGCAAILITLGIMAIGGLIGMAVGAGTSAIMQYAFNGEVNWKSVGVAALSGFVSGAIAASPLGLGWQIVAGGLIGGASYVAECYVNDTAMTLDGAIWAVGLGAFSGWLGGPGANKDYVMTNAVLQLRKTMVREARRANQVYAQKAIASMTSYVHNFLTVETWAASIKFAAGCGITNAVTGVYSEYINLGLPGWKPWE